MTLPTVQKKRALDLICLGRVAVDLYAQQLGARLEDVTSFAKHLGGSPANIAFGAARLGLKSALVSRVGDDPMGRFILETLAREGCDTRGVRIDPKRLTALALLGLKDRYTNPLVFYRENCADMALGAEDVDEDFIASSRALLVSGTHLSTEGVFAVSRRAIEFAERHDVRRALDIDYRPVLWGLSGKAAGDIRYVADAGVSRRIQSILPKFDLVFGTEEEFRMAGGQEDLTAALRQVRDVTAGVLVVKLGARGCMVLDGPIPATLAAAPLYPAIEVEVLNVLGAGDAFAAGFLYGWLTSADLAGCCQLANLCGGLVVSRHACAPAMPTRAEIDHLLAAGTAVARPDCDETVHRLHRVSARREEWGPLYILAFDHRRQLVELAQQAGRPLESIGHLKRLFLEAVESAAGQMRERGTEGSIGLLADERFAQDVLNDATGRGLWIARPVELPGSRPLVFEHGRSIGSHLTGWPREQIVKCLVQFHPDDAPLLRLEQEAQIRSLYEATRASGHDLLLELVVPRLTGEGGDLLYRAMCRLYNIGVYPEWWKLQPQPREVWRRVDELIARRDPYCCGVVLLGLNAAAEELAEAFREAAESRACRGFAIGRTIFQGPSLNWLRGEIEDAALVSQVREAFVDLIDAWREARKTAQGAAAPEEAGR
ncbi:MAG: 5-dehydro-2-deoxygluconokinase [Gammaproteobacteria bacterium]|nr:5-dehydro-2-deoxygluconokinase [Gammaproteobacteria bacterium]